MKSRTKTLLVFLSFVCALAAHTFLSQASAQENPHRLEHKLSAGSKVTLRLISGDIRVTGWDGDTVQVLTDEDDNGRSVLAITEDSDDDATRPGVFREGVSWPSRKTPGRVASSSVRQPIWEASLLTSRSTFHVRRN
ncbi:MAG: hypothetical protein K1Y36_18090 [Blastocatellia bacterium]|nr:hypothetical protein [Blastocatellia bacterium]